MTASSSPQLDIVRLLKDSSDPSQWDDALQLIQEYYEAIDVVVRDTPEGIRSLLDQDASGIWLAYWQEQPAGCVVLRELASQPTAGECKRLYVRSAFRGHGIADTLMDALESFAAERGKQWIYLDSKDDLQAALALYRRRGYEPCARYNDNPQATIFLRKQIGL